MTTNILSPNWEGEYAPPVDPSAIRFKAQPSYNCDGCLFLGQRNSVCDHAGKIAASIEQPDCDQLAPNGMTYIYVLDKSDPRQLDLLKVNHGR